VLRRRVYLQTESHMVTAAVTDWHYGSTITLLISCTQLSRLRYVYYDEKENLAYTFNCSGTAALMVDWPKSREHEATNAWVSKIH
jgi:hypothetical protein